jgi:hypothetical protein
MKIKVHTTEPITRTVSRSFDHKQVETDCGNGLVGKKWQATVESVDYTGRLEVYIDMKKLMDHYAKTAFNNKQLRFVRGPIEVRVVDRKEVPGTRKQEVR